MALQLQLGKQGDQGKKLTLSLTKGSRFRVELFWDSEHDLDAHALLATNDGNGAKVSALEQILSTYNMKANNPNGVLLRNADGSFNTPEGALHHSGDCRNGKTQDVDEVITIDGVKIPSGVNEIPVFVTIHPASTGNFALVKAAGIRIKDGDGNVLAEYELTHQYGEFNAVQMGSLMFDPEGWKYHAVGVGFNGDFNTVLGYFS
jgi:tellurium resistance protein TerD